MALYVVTAQALDNDEFDFYPLLLDDEPILPAVLLHWRAGAGASSPATHR